MKSESCLSFKNGSKLKLGGDAKEQYQGYENAFSLFQGFDLLGYLKKEIRERESENKKTKTVILDKASYDYLVHQIHYFDRETEVSEEEFERRTKCETQLYIKGIPVFVEEEALAFKHEEY